MHSIYGIKQESKGVNLRSGENLLGVAITLWSNAFNSSLIFIITSIYCRYFT